MTSLVWFEPAVQLLPWVYGITFVIGLCFGSFLNVMAHRFLTEQSIAFPASHCPACQTPLRWFENIPVLAYLLQRGQCRSCQATIGLEYPLAELATGVLFVLVIWFAGLSLQALLLLFLVCNLMVITITDFKESLIFQINSLSLIPAGLLYSLLDLGHTSEGILDLVVFQVPESFGSALIGVFAAFVIFEGMILISEWALGTEGFGHGDTHLMMGVGAFLGWKMMVLALLLGFILQAVPAIPMLILQWIRRKDYISLGAGAAGVLFGLAPLGISALPLPNRGMETALILLSFVLTIVALVIFLKRMKSSQSFSYLPLGPALVLGSVLMLFWGPQWLAHYYP